MLQLMLMVNSEKATAIHKDGGLVVYGCEAAYHLYTINHLVKNFNNAPSSKVSYS